MTTEQEWLGNTPYSHPSMPKNYILAIPEHVAALPEEEQGPALVQEIHDRKGWSVDKHGEAVG